MVEIVADNPIGAFIAVIAVGGFFYTIAIGFISFGRWQGEVNADRLDFHNFMKEIRAKLDSISERLPKQPPLWMGASPIKLTERGKKISDEANAVEIASWLLTKYEGSDDDSDYQVQERCFYLANKNNLKEDQIRLLEDCAYQNGIDMKAILRVVAIELRDIIMYDRRIRRQPRDG